MVRFEELPDNVRKLILEKLELAMKAHNAYSIHHLAKIKKTDAMDYWRSLCRKAGLPLCTLPAGYDTAKQQARQR
jgi:hypothetical protein